MFIKEYIWLKVVFYLMRGNKEKDVIKLQDIYIYIYIDVTSEEVKRTLGGWLGPLVYGIKFVSLNMCMYIYIYIYINIL